MSVYCPFIKYEHSICQMIFFKVQSFGIKDKVKEFFFTNSNIHLNLPAK